MDDAELKAEIRRLTEAADKLTFEADNAAGAFKGVAKSFGIAEDKISSITYGMKTIGSGVTSFSRNLTSSELTFSKYSTAVDQTVSGLTGIFSSFGPLGTALKALGDVTSALVGAVFKQNDAYLGAYDTLSKFGYAGTDVADSLFDITKGTGYAGARINELVDVTTGLGNNLTFLGKTAGDGMKKFFEIATISDDQRAELIRLGYSQKEITENQAEFIKQQTLLGTLRFKDATDLKRQTLNYSKHLIELAALTGQSTEQIKKEQERDLQNYAFNSLLRDEEAKAAKGLPNNLEKFREGVSQIGADFGESARVGFREILATDVAQGDEALGLLRLTGGGIIQWTKQFKRGEMTIEQLEKKISEAQKTAEKTQGEAMVMNKELADANLQSAELARGASKDYIDERRDIVKRQVDGMTQPKEGGLKETQIERMKLELQTQTAFQTLVNLIADYVNPAFTYLLKGLDKLTSGFMGTLERMGVVDPDFQFMFKDASELSKILAEKQSKLSDLYKEKAQTPDVMNPEPFSAGFETAADAIQKKITEQEREIQGIKTRLKMLTGSEAPAIQPQSSVSTSGSSSGMGGGDFTSVNNNLNFGINSGPMSGYPSEMSGLTGIVPLPDGKSIPVKFTNLPSEFVSKKKNPLSDTSGLAGLLSGYASSIVNQSTSMVNSIEIDNSKDDSSGLLNLFSSKMDTLLDNVTKNNDLQGELLTYIRR